MAKNKFYGIAEEGVIFDNWSECESYVKGKSVKFKGFATQAEAEVFAGLRTASKPSLPGYTCYVDGSFGSKSPFAGWGWILLNEGEKIAYQNGRTPKEALSRNIDGELYAAIDAMRYAIAKNLGTITLCHDYEGIEAWATGRWQAKSEIAKAYVNVYQNLKQDLRVRFKKVSAHSGEYWNEQVDALAKAGITKK